MLELKAGQEIDGRVVDKITMNEDTRDMTVWFDTDKLIVKQNQSIDKVLNHKWEKQHGYTDKKV